MNGVLTKPTWIQGPALPLMNFVTLGESLILSFLICKVEGNTDLY